MGFYQCIIYEYPETMLCEQCYFGVHVEAESLGSFSYLCQARCTLNDGRSCPTFLEKEED